MLIFYRIRRETIPQNSQLLANSTERLRGATKGDVLLARTLENVFILEPTQFLPSHERKVDRVVRWGSERREWQERCTIVGRKRVLFT